MSDNPTTALVKTTPSPALARVSNQLALTDKLLTKPEEPFLIPYRKGTRWGYCNRNKDIVIECVYDEAWPFQEGLAVVCLGKTAKTLSDLTTWCHMGTEYWED